MCRIHNSSLHGLTILILSVLSLAAPAAADEKVLDDFESYQGGATIAVDAKSSPWGRYGHAVNDNPVVTGADGRRISDKLSAVFPLGWEPQATPARTNATVRKTLEAPTDLTAYDAVAFKVRSLQPQPAAPTTVKLVVTDGSTSFSSKAPQELTGDGEDLRFELADTAMQRSDGHGSYENVLRNATGIGFRFENTTATGSETVNFDDVRLISGKASAGTAPATQPATPEKSESP